MLRSRIVPPAIDQPANQLAGSGVMIESVTRAQQQTNGELYFRIAHQLSAAQSIIKLAAV
jgi:hypothetical protein